MPLQTKSTKTAFPRLDLQTEFLDDLSERGLQKEGHIFETKEEQDVAVFIALAQNMAFTSLIHLLQAQSETRNLASCYCSSEKVHKLSNGGKPATEPRPRPKVKKFRFAEVTGNSVRTVINEFEKQEDTESLWWSPEELLEIRQDNIRVVLYFRKYRQDYIDLVEDIAEASRNDDCHSEKMGQCLKKLSYDNFARGLEAHIVSNVAQRRREFIKAVMEEQEECKRCQDSYEQSCESIRQSSLALSQQSQTFAQRIAECDQLEALKALLSPWMPEIKVERTVVIDSVNKPDWYSQIRRPYEV
jgi:hypothetical protein